MKPNTVTFTCADGREERFSLQMPVERGAVIADAIDGAPMAAVMSSSNQLWIPGLPAKYFLRDIVNIEFTCEDEPPVLPAFEDDGHDYANRPNVSATCAATGCVGTPMVFSGWADDYDVPIAAIEFSLDEGVSWSRFETTAATVGRLTMWSFTWTPPAPGSYAMRVRAVNGAGTASPIPALCRFEVLDEERG